MRQDADRLVVFLVELDRIPLTMSYYHMTSSKSFTEKNRRDLLFLSVHFAQYTGSTEDTLLHKVRNQMNMFYNAPRLGESTYSLPIRKVDKLESFLRSSALMPYRPGGSLYRRYIAACSMHRTEVF